MKILPKIFLFIALFFTRETFSQDNLYGEGGRYEIYAFQQMLKDGDIEVLLNMKKFLNDNYSRMILNDGSYTVREAAMYILREMTLFTPEEIIIDSNLTSKQYADFITLNKNKIHFSKAYNSFFITPLENRKVNYKIRELSSSQLFELEKKRKKILTHFKLWNPTIDKFLKEKDPISLKLIAEEYFRASKYFSEEHFNNRNDYEGALKLFTGVEIGLILDKDSISYRLPYAAIEKLPFVIYWVNHYSDYKFDESLNRFVNLNDSVQQLTEIEKLFDLLKSSDDSTAMNAYIKLTNSDTEEIIKIAWTLQSGSERMEANNSIGTFPYSFVIQLSQLTKYCRDNDIDYTGSEILQENIKRLMEDLEFSERLKLENYLIENLTLDEATAVEYWAAINEDSWGLTYSAGRILDKLYSKHWQELINDEKKLKLFLKKADLYHNFGIIGSGYHFYIKFENSSQETLQKLNSIVTDDENILSQLNKTLILNSDSIKSKLSKISNNIYSEVNKDKFSGDTSVIKFVDDRDLALKVRLKQSDSNYDSYVENPVKEIFFILNRKIKERYTEFNCSKVISKINYEQIPEILNIADKINFENYSYQYDFLPIDFGIPIKRGSLENNQVIEEFLENYKKYSEYELYEYYLDKTGIDYKNTDGTLNYDKIYWILKYDVVQAFVGGGGGERDTGIYALIKLLEINFNTRLNYPQKLCNSRDLFGCSPKDRANEWMVFLKEKGLLSFIDSEPRSFNQD